MGWVAAGVVTSVVGGVMSYNASKKAGKKQQEAYEYQAKVNQRNAKVHHPKLISFEGFRPNGFKIHNRRIF